MLVAMISHMFLKQFKSDMTLILSLRCHSEAPEVETLSEQGDVRTIG